MWESTLLFVPDVDAWKGYGVEDEVFCFHFHVVGLGVSSSVGERRLNADLATLSLGRCAHLIVW